MRLTLLLTLFLLTSCSEKHQLVFSEQVNEFSCPKVDNCLSSKNKSDSYILPIKMMGEDESQNITNISKVVNQFDDIKIIKFKGPYLHIAQDEIHIEFLADKKSRSVLIRSQRSSTSVFSSNKGKKLIEEIRFKLYQNDY